jgi:hypothetical protein
MTFQSGKYARMHGGALRRIAAVAGAFLLTTGCGGTGEPASSSDAITYGEPDAGRHPNVGALMILFTPARRSAP